MFNLKFSLKFARNTPPISILKSALERALVEILEKSLQIWNQHKKLPVWPSFYENRKKGKTEFEIPANSNLGWAPAQLGSAPAQGRHEAGATLRK